MKNILAFIEDPDYVVFYIQCGSFADSFYPLQKIKPVEVDGDLRAFIQGSPTYIDLYNLNYDEIKVFPKEVKF